MANNLEFYGDSISGNCYKLQLVCSELDIDYIWHELDRLSGATRTHEFLKLNPNGKVPLMVLPDGRCMPESNAILSYLADGSSLRGSDRYDLKNYPAVRDWLERVAARPRYVAMRAPVKQA